MRRILAFALVPVALGAQAPLADRIANTRNGTVAFSANTRANVCGDGKLSYSDGLSGPRTRFYDGMLLTHGPWDNRVPPCDHGPMRITLRMVDGNVSALRTTVGTASAVPDSVRDLGLVSDADAGRYLANLARQGEGRVSEAAMLPLVMLDSTSRWSILGEAAVDTTRLLRYRRRASDILARAAAGTLGLGDLDEDDESIQRREAVNALARRDTKEDDPVPRLLEIARTNSHRDVRRAALYQLGQNADRRAVAYFLELLRSSQ
jgi:hypothetical protein